MRNHHRLADFKSLIFVFQIILSTGYVFSMRSVASEATHIFQLINERLAYMEGVALYKREAGKPIEDIARENLVLEKSLIKASKSGLNPDSTVDFFQIQVNAAKAVQYRYQADWLFNPPLAQKYPDLVSVVRPNLIRIGDELIESISKYLKKGQHFNDDQKEAFFSAIEVHNLSGQEKDRIYKTLQDITLR